MSKQQSQRTGHIDVRNLSVAMLGLVAITALATLLNALVNAIEGPEED